MPGEITQVTVNGLPVETLDAAGNFFARVLIHPGVNDFDLQAFDQFDQSVMAELSIVGLVASSGIDFSKFADITGSLGVTGVPRLNTRAFPARSLGASSDLGACVRFLFPCPSR